MCIDLKMSKDLEATAVQPNTSVATDDASAKSALEAERPLKGRRARRVSTKERVSKVPNVPGRRSSIYRGVTRHRWTGRYEAHLWDKSCWNQTQNKKGRQVYLGAYDDEEAAARAYDLAALKYWGAGTVINFPLTDYARELEDMPDVSKEEYLASLRRKSSGFSRGVSKYRGVARHHHNGRWEARIGRIFGNKYLYLGTYSTQEEAAAAYDMAAIEYRGLNAVTNFDLSRYIRWLRPGQDGNVLSPVDLTGIPMGPLHTQGSFIAADYPAVSVQEQMEQDMWDPSQACESGDHPLANEAGVQVTNPSGSALGFLFQSNVFKQMLDKASIKEQELADQSPDLSRSDTEQTQSDPLKQNGSSVDVKHELTFQEEVRHVFDQPEMSMVDQPEDLTFGGATSALDRIFFQSDMSFPYFPINTSPADMMDQGVTLPDSAISSFNALSLPYPISTCS